MSLFSFGSSKHAHFHARVTLHELDNVPLLDGNFAVKWKVAGAHALSASALAAEKEKEHKEREKLRRAVAAAAGKDETPGGSGTSTPGSPPKKHRHHHHHHHHHYVSQQISQQSQQSSPPPEEAETTPAYRSSKRAARLAASDPGGSGPFLMASGANDASEAPAASDTVSAPHSREPSGCYGAVPPGTSAGTSISEHGKTEGGLPGAASASSSSEGSEPAPNDDGPVLGMTPVEAPSAQQVDKGKGKMLPPPVPRAATTGSALQQAQSQPHHKPSRLSRLLHTLSPLSNSHSGDAASSAAGSSGAAALSSPSSVLSPAPAQQRSSRSTSSSAAAASGSKKGKLRRLPSPPISALVQEDRRSSGADYSRSASGSGGGSSRQKHTRGNAKERDTESYWDERPGSGSVGDGSNGHGSWGSSSGSKGLHVTQPLTPGLDLTRERPSLSSKHSSSRLSTGSSRSRDKEPSPTSNGKHGAHTLPHAHLPQHLIPHIPIPGVGSGTSGSGSGSGSRPGSAGGSGAQTPALGGAAAQFEPKGLTDQVAVKDHTVKWDRTFEVGLRIPIEKYKPPQDAQSSSGANGQPMSRDQGTSSAGNNAAAGGSDDSLPNGGSGGGSSSHGGEGGSSGAGAGGDKQGDGIMPRKRSKSSLHNDLSASPLLGVSPANAELERERERQRELAEAWGMLGSATLRLVVKQRIETDESHGTQSDSEAGFVELNLAEYAPWPPSHLQAQVLAPHKPHSSKHRHHRMPKRVETRRYLLRDSKSNSRLKLTIELTFISGTAEYAVPRIQRGVPVDNLSDYVHMSAAMVGGISRRQQQLHTQMQQLQHLEACGGGDCDCDRMSMRSSAGGSSRGVSNRPSSSSLMHDARAGRSSTSLSMQSDPYGDLLIGGCEPILRPSIPAKNFRDGQGSTAASRARSSLGTSASSFGAPYGERDPTSIIEMIFDQAKFHATTPARSQHNEKTAGHGDKQLPHSLTMPPPSSFPAPVRQMTLPCLLEPKRAQNSSSTGSPKRSSFLFKSRKSSTKVSSGDGESNASSPSVPSKLASVFSRSTSSSASASDSGSLATPTDSDRLGADMSRSSSNLAAPPLTASPTQLSPVASRGESERSVDAPAAEADSAAREGLKYSVSIDTTGAKASASQLSVPDIDISSPSGRTFASFTSRQQSFAAVALGAGAVDPDSSASFDQADSSLSSDSFSFSSGKPPLRRHSSTPAMMTPMADTVAIKKPAVANIVDGDSRSVKSDVLDLKKEQTAKARVGKRGIAPEIAHARGYRGVGWQTTQSNGSSDSQPSLVQPQPRMQAQTQHLLDLPYAALSRHGSSESYGSLSSSITPPYTIAQTPPALVTAAE